jgi:hypothetical protein
MFPRPFFEDVGRYLLPVLLLNVPQTILTSASSQDEPGLFLKIAEQCVDPLSNAPNGGGI